MIVKTETERELLRESGKRLAHVLREVAAIVRPGVSTAALDAKAREVIAEFGDTPAFLGYTPEGADRPYPSALCVSVNDEIVHGISNENPRVLREGDIVALDCGVNHKGFFSDSAITVGVGKISKENQQLIYATQEALAAQIEAAVAGNTLGDIGHAAEYVANKHGYGYPYELGGHGVGSKVHEKPFIRNYGTPGKGEKLIEGQVLALEPMLSLGQEHGIELASDGYTYKTADGSVAAHFEHTVIVGKDSAEIITK